MAKQAGFLKRLKNTIGKGISKIATGLNKFVQTSMPAINMIPVAGPAIAEVLKRTTNTATQFGDMLQGKITRNQFGNHLVDTYKSGALVAPYRLARAAHEGRIQQEIRNQYSDAMSYLDYK